MCSADEDDPGAGRLAGPDEVLRVRDLVVRMRRDVERGPDSVQCAAQRRLVAEVADDLLDVGAEAARSPGANQHPDVSPVLAEGIENGSADGTGGSDHQDRRIKINNSDGHGSVLRVGRAAGHR